MSDFTHAGTLTKADAARYIRAAGVDGAISLLSGPFGIRRFVLFFEVRGEAVRLVHMATVNLGWGGGPPPPDHTGELQRMLEAAMTRMYRNMATGPRWSRCAMAYVRDVDGRSSIYPSFDGDVDKVSLSGLPMIGPPGHPLESPQTLDIFAQFQAAVEPVRHQTSVITPDWDDWEIKDDTRLLLHYPDAPDEHDRVRGMRCLALATFAPRWDRFMWHVDPPLFPDAVFTTPSFSASWPAAFEVGLLAVARLQASWLFAQPIDEYDKMLLAAVWR